MDGLAYRPLFGEQMDLYAGNDRPWFKADHARAEREGWHVVATHADEGVSGSTSLAMRAGGKALFADALAKRFDVLIIDGLDWLSLEIGEAETIVKRLEHGGVCLLGTADG